MRSAIKTSVASSWHFISTHIFGFTTNFCCGVYLSERLFDKVLGVRSMRENIFSRSTLGLFNDALPTSEVPHRRMMCLLRMMSLKGRAYKR